MTKVSEIEQEAKAIAEKLELGNRIFKTSKREAKVTLKDHKGSFSHNPTCRLLNPTKPEIGKISKQILARQQCRLTICIELDELTNSEYQYQTARSK